MLGAPCIMQLKPRTLIPKGFRVSGVIVYASEPGGVMTTGAALELARSDERLRNILWV